VPLCEMTEVASVAAFLPRIFFENAEQEGKPHLAIWTAFCTTAAHPLHTRRGNGKLSLSENPPSTHTATATADLWILRFPFFCQFVSWPQLQHTNVSFVLPVDSIGGELLCVAGTFTHFICLVGSQMKTSQKIYNDFAVFLNRIHSLATFSTMFNASHLNHQGYKFIMLASCLRKDSDL